MEGLRKAGFRIIILKNKWKFPTPLGYSDLNTVLGVPLEGRYAGVEYLCEVQLNLLQMLQAKNEAHKPYEIIRSRLPQLCQGTAVDAGKLEFQVGKGEDDYKLFSPEEYSKIRRLDVGGGGGK